MQIDFKNLWQALVEKNLTTKKVGEMSKEEIELLVKIVRLFSREEEGNGVDDVPF